MLSIILEMAMRNESARRLDSSRDHPEGKGGGHPWPEEVTELLDHLAVELALEYVQLMEQAAESEDATPDRAAAERSDR
jgi:hypothetical protein